jgi:alpha-ketoglutarate-dependent taurine dioxygenase
MPISTEPLTGSDFVVEVSGIDLSEPQDAETVAALRTALGKHSILVFRQQSLTNEQQIAFSRNFGELEIHLVRQYLMPEHPEIIVLSNVGAGGVKPTANGGAYWHSDISYRAKPPLGSLLYGVAVPPEGGNTLFANMYGAYDTLSDDLKNKVDGRNAVHSYLGRFMAMRDRDTSHKGEDKFELDEEQKESFPPVLHPIVRTHPESGRKALFVNDGFTIGIEDMDEDDGKALLRELNIHATREPLVYSHAWQPGDVVFWDNRSTMHCATSYDPVHTRTMHRTTIQGDTPY